MKQTTGRCKCSLKFLLKADKTFKQAKGQALKNARKPETITRLKTTMVIATTKV